MFQWITSFCSFLVATYVVIAASAISADEERDRWAAAMQRLSAAKHEGEELLAYYKEDVKPLISRESCRVRKYYIKARASFNSLIDAMIVEVQEGDGLADREHEEPLRDAEHHLTQFVTCVEANEPGIPVGKGCFTGNVHTSCKMGIVSRQLPGGEILLGGPEVNTDLSELGVMLGESGVRGDQNLNRLSEEAKAEIIEQLEAQKWRPYSDM